MIFIHLTRFTPFSIVSCEIVKNTWPGSNLWKSCEKYLTMPNVGWNVNKCNNQVKLPDQAGPLCLHHFHVLRHRDLKNIVPLSTKLIQEQCFLLYFLFISRILIYGKEILGSGEMAFYIIAQEESSSWFSYF